MNNYRTYSIFFFLALCAPVAALAQLEVGGDMLDNCGRIEALYDDDKTLEARDAARQCLEAIEQELESQVGQYFLEEVAGWKRSRFEQNKAMGFTNTAARYSKGGNTVNVSLTGGFGGGGTMGGLGALAQMGMMQSGKQVRVANLPATISPDGDVMVVLSDGSMLMFESPDFNDADSALEGMGDLINEFPVADINATLSET